MSDEKKVIYFCPNCGKTYSGDPGNEMACKSCKSWLQQTNVPVLQWREYTDDKKAEMKKAWKKKDDYLSDEIFTGDEVSMNSEQSMLRQVIREMRAANSRLDTLAHDLHFIYTLVLIQFILGLILGIYFGISLAGLMF